jgi:hypothetical protein
MSEPAGERPPTDLTGISASEPVHFASISSRLERIAIYALYTPTSPGKFVPARVGKP